MTQAYTNRFSEVHELADWYVPASRGAGAYPTAYVNMANHQRAIFVLLTGTMAGTSTVDLSLWQATDALGAGPAKPIAGKVITQLTQAGGDGNDAVLIELRTEEMDVSGGFCYVQARLVVGNAATLCSLLPLYGCSNYVPVSVANWTEIVD
jgi:hypothetical protein